MACRRSSRQEAASAGPHNAAAPFVEFRAGTELRRRLDDAFESAGLARTIAFELGQLTEMIAFAAAGLGTAIVPLAFTTELPAHERNSVHVLRVAEPILPLTVCAYTRPALCPPAARALAERIVALKAGDLAVPRIGSASAPEGAGPRATPAGTR
jgi:DNA-binding transcriptional LysR family regulator